MRSIATTWVLACGFSAALMLGATAEPDPRQVPLARENPLYLDGSASVDARARDLIARLTLEEKAQALNHAGPDLDRFGLRSDKWNQCLNGVQWDQPTTLFPSCLALAATWNPAFVQNEVARVISDEARGIYNGWRADPSAPGDRKGLIYRAPVINIERNPYWGRNYEAWGEDPFLTGRMGVAYVKGLQGDDPRHLKVAATLKHYAVNNVEIDRTKLDANVSPRWLHEYWLPHFRDAVVEGKVASLMASYNAINGVPNNINHWLLTDLLKKEWAHAGFVVSDLGGVNSMVQGHANKAMAYVDAVARSVMAGCDFSDREYQENIPAAVRAGKLTEARLDDALFRVLRVRFLLGEFDPLDASPYGKISRASVNSPAHHAVAREAARQSIVLLQNRGDLLPLDTAKLRRIAVVGPFAEAAITHGYNGNHPGIITARKGIAGAVGDGVEVLHSQGGFASTAPVLEPHVERVYSGGIGTKLHSGGVGEFIEFDVRVPRDGRYRIGVHFKSAAERAIFQASVDGEKFGDPVDMYEREGRYGIEADLGSGQLAAGLRRLRFTVVGRHPASRGHTGIFDKVVLSGPEKFEVEVEEASPRSGAGSDRDLRAEAVDAAKRADAVILCLGSDTRNELEGRDRTFLGLPGDQLELARAVLAANPRTVVVLMGAGPLTIPELKEKAPAILQAWWPGHEGGVAIAEVIFGRTNPAGRLPHTVYASEEQVPPVDEYDVSRGFTYLYLRGAPLFAFGHGLSYTRFAYSDLRVTKIEVEGGEALEATYRVKNVGGRAGDEVPQLYVRQLNPTVARPRHELRGFQRIGLAVGETRTVTMRVPLEKLAYYDEGAAKFVVPSGDYEIQVGAASDDIRLRSTVAVK